jgi:hypothetical protein
MTPKILSIRIPSPVEVLAMGRPHNPSNWENHLRYVKAVGDPGPLLAVLRYADQFRTKFTRQHVFDIADKDDAAGAVAAVVWGFPSGGRPGGFYKSFAALFGKAVALESLISEIRSSAGGDPQVALSRLSLGQPGIGFATTSKVAYFARLAWRGQSALIYDRNVIDAVIDHSDVFMSTASQVGSGRSHGRCALAYSSFISEAHFQASHLDAQASQIEAALFVSRTKRNWL